MSVRGTGQLLMVLYVVHGRLQTLGTRISAASKTPQLTQFTLLRSYL